MLINEAIQKIWCQDDALLTQLGLPDVDQHVCIGAMAHWEIVVMSAIVVLYGFFLSAPWHDIVIKFTPLMR